MLKTLNKWIKTSTPWQTLSRFFLVWLFTSTLVISSVTIFGIAPPTPAQAATACVPNVFYASQFGGTALYAIDIGTGETRQVGNLAVQTAAISRDAATGRIFYIENNPGQGISDVYYFDPATGLNQRIGSTNVSPPLPAGGAGVFIKMAQRDNGDIYAAASNNRIFKLNQSNGSTTELTITPALPTGSGDIAFDPNNSTRLFVTIQTGTTLELYSVDITTGVRTLVTSGPPPVVPNSGSTAFGPDGNLYVAELVAIGGVTTLRSMSTSNGSVGSTLNLTLENGANIDISDFATLPTRSPRIDMDVQKTGSNTAAVAGGSFSYTIRLSNQGDCDVRGVKLLDTLPIQFTGATWTSRFVQAADETLTGFGQMTPATGAGNVDATVNLSVGARLIVTVTGTINPATANGANITNTVVAVSDRFIRSTVTTPVINILGGTPDLRIRKDVAPTYSTGGNVVYTLRINNEGTAIPGGLVTVADPGPPGTTFVSSSSNVGTCTAFPCTFAPALFPVAPAAGVVITATYSTSAGTPLRLDNIASVSTVGEDPRLLGNNTARATTVAPAPPVVLPPVIPQVVDVAIAITAPPAVPPGANFTVTLTASNVGNLSADNVVVSYDVPVGVTVVSVPDGCIYNPTASTIICAAIPTFGRGATAVYNFVFKAPDTPSVLTGIARISTTSPEPNTGNNTAAATTTVAIGAPNPTLPPGIVIPPVVIPPVVIPPVVTPPPNVLGSALQASPPVNNRDGTETVTLTVTINNTGTQPLSNLQAIIDLIKTFAGTQDFVVVSINSSTFVVNPNFNGRDIQNLLAAGNILAPGGSGTITFSIRVTPGFNLGPYFASLTVQGTDPNGVIVTDISTLGNVPDANGNGTPSDDVTPTPIQFTGFPNLRIVKRMTGALRNGVPLTTNLNFNTFLDDPNDGNDNAPGWSALSPIGLARITEANLLQSGDDLEYTVYFLSDGTGVATNAQFCDPIPAGSTFLADTYGGGSGTLLRLEGTERPQTNGTDGDQGRFIPALTPSPSPCPSLNNPNGAVFVQIPTLSNRSPNNVGFMRFRVKID
jgi:uncharacterized repeat protein (TIGR01451 family)